MKAISISTIILWSTIPNLIAACGNRVVNVGEQCDNGNARGCISCLVQSGFYCSGSPSECVLASSYNSIGKGTLVVSSTSQPAVATLIAAVNKDIGSSGVTLRMDQSAVQLINSQYFANFEMTFTNPTSIPIVTRVLSTSLANVGSNIRQAGVVDIRYSATCGNLIVELGEQCDASTNDGCSGSCTPIAGVSCVFTTVDQTQNMGQICTKCGNSVVDSNEECDDGNLLSGDGCSRNCLRESSTQSCGNGVVQSGEQCDDGNLVSGDGCNSLCYVESGYSCTLVGSKSFCARQSPNCGDGVLNPNEFCDDGNLINGDGCSATCAMEVGFVCTTVLGARSVCIRSTAVTCGDGVVQVGEGCDDGNIFNGDGCSSTCAVESGYTCTNQLQFKSVCYRISASVCGNGVLETTEACDDGNIINNDGCSSLCNKEIGFTCTTVLLMKSICASNTVCGNGLFENGEGCDDGNSASGDGCSSLCQVESSFYCTTQKGSLSVCSRNVVCGDGNLDLGEDCDDGNGDGADGCSSNCKVEIGFICSRTNKSVCTTSNGCGNGKVESGEACDDGNVVSGDGCSSTCVAEAGFACGGGKCYAGCGDSLVVDPEQCDDGNVRNGDGCSPSCQIENGYSCSRVGAKSSCSISVGKGSDTPDRFPEWVIPIIIISILSVCCIVGALLYWANKKTKRGGAKVVYEEKVTVHPPPMRPPPLAICHSPYNCELYDTYTVATV